MWPKGTWKWALQPHSLGFPSLWAIPDLSSLSSWGHRQCKTCPWTRLAFSIHSACENNKNSCHFISIHYFVRFILLFLILCMHMFMSVYRYVCTNASVHGSQRLGIPWMLGLLTVLSCWKWVLGTKLQSSARSVHMLDCWSGSSAPCWLSFKMAFDKLWWCLETWRSREVFWWSPLRAKVSCHY